MAIGLGLSIGTVNTICALAADGPVKCSSGRRPPPDTWRTTLTFDSTGAARVGRIPKHGRVVTEFADLTQRSVRGARIAHRALSAADLVATVAEKVVEEVMGHESDIETAITVTHPAGYCEEQRVELRAALDGAGLPHAVLVSEPVAAAAWLEAEHGPLPPGLALVYDLGGSGLDVAVVRVGAGSSRYPVVGEPLSSPDFGGRAFAALMAQRAMGADLGTDSVSRSVSETETSALRAAHIRRSLGVVYECLRIADVTMADVGRVLAVGGAVRPPEVAEVLAAELARPVIMAPDPERTIADGAAVLARRRVVATRDDTEQSGAGHSRLFRRRARVAVTAAMALTGVGITLVVPGDGAATDVGRAVVEGPAVRVTSRVP